VGGAAGGNANALTINAGGAGGNATCALAAAQTTLSGGGPGGAGIIGNKLWVTSGEGGGDWFGTGSFRSQANNATARAGVAGNPYGVGGSGACVGNGAGSANGGNGKQGVLIIYEYA
jgi:hypothetical protein